MPKKRAKRRKSAKKRTPKWLKKLERTRTASGRFRKSPKRKTAKRKPAKRKSGRVLVVVLGKSAKRKTSKRKTTRRPTKQKHKKVKWPSWKELGMKSGKTSEGTLGLG